MTVRRIATTRLLTWLTSLVLVIGATGAPPAAAQGDQVVAGGTAGADQQGTVAFASRGPVIPGPDYIEPIADFASPRRDTRLIVDAAGHLLAQGTTTSREDNVPQLLAMNPDDGSVDWRIEDIADGCQPVATADGRIFAQYEPNSGVANFSADPVEIDAATGQVTNRYTSPDTDELPRIGECLDGLRLTPEGVLIAYQGSNFDVQLVGFDTTANPMTELWRYDADDSSDAGGSDRVVLSPDGSVATIAQRLPRDENDDLELRVVQVDTATGDVLGKVTVAGSQLIADGLIHTGETLLVLTQFAGGFDDPPRIVALDADTLQQRWVVAAVDDTPFDGLRRIALAGATIVVHTGRDLVGLDVEDGSFRWEALASSFTNNAGQVVVDGAGKAYFSSFGGSPLEVIDTVTGDSLFEAPRADEFLGTGVPGEAATLGPILPDGRLYALHSLADGGGALVAYGSGRARLDGGTGDVIDIAIQLCQYLFADDAARTVVLSRDDLFADTLAGAPLAGGDSCILFTPGGADEEIDPRTLAEIQRALPDGALVRIAGGENAVSAAVAASVADAGFQVERLAGPTRIQTAVEIARVVMEEGAARQPNGEVVAMVARADDWPDAVAGGAALSALGSPVLLSGTDSLHPDTDAVLDELGVTSTIIAGGTVAVSDAAAAATPNPTRVSGVNRHATAAAFATDIWSDLAAEDSFVLANLEFEQGWALALAAAPLSVRLAAPQLGVRATNLPSETATYLRDQGVTDPSLLVLGDLTVVQDDVVDAVEVETGGP